MTNNNPYIQTLNEKGYSVKECQTPSKVKKTFPLNLYGRVYQTQKEYDEALHEFLNGN